MEKKDNGSPDKECNQVSVLHLVLLGMVIITPCLTPGMAIVFSAIALPQLDLNLDQASWFASILTAMTPFGNLFTGLIMDKYGRKVPMILGIISDMCGWFLLSLPNASLTQLYVGRLMTGFALGVASLPSQVYAAECIITNNIYWRSSLTTWTTMALGIGALLSFSLSMVFKYNEVAFIAGILSIISLMLIIFFIPESPVWLHRQNRIGDAELAQKRLGIVQPILKTLRRGYVDKNTSENSNSREIHISESKLTLHNFVRYTAKVTRSDVYKPLTITISFLFFLQFSGLFALSAYMINIIKVCTLSFNPYALSVIYGIINLVGILLLTFILPFAGVKRMAIISTAGVALGMCILGMTTIVRCNKIIDIIHVVSVWGISIFQSLGFTALPFSILGEIFPMGAKGFASISLIMSSSFNFIVLKMHPLLYQDFGGYLYFGYGIISACCTIFVVLFLPETVGKTLEEIKKEFRNDCNVTIVNETNNVNNSINGTYNNSAENLNIG